MPRYGATSDEKVRPRPRFLGRVQAEHEDNDEDDCQGMAAASRMDNAEVLSNLVLSACQYGDGESL